MLSLVTSPYVVLAPGAALRRVYIDAVFTSQPRAEPQSASNPISEPDQGLASLALQVGQGLLPKLHSSIKAQHISTPKDQRRRRYSKDEPV